MNQQAIRRGSISLRLYPHLLGPEELLKELAVQASLGVSSGFDGVMVSERHGGVPGSVPNPLQVVGWLLSEMPSGWAAACPLLLPFRPAAIVAEEVAWLASRFPGRVAVGFGSGGNRPDFDLHGIPFEDRGRLFKERLREVVEILGGADEAPLHKDPAIAAAYDHGLTVLSAAMSRRAVERAASLGLGIIDSSLPSLDDIAKLHDFYVDAGGTGPHVLIRRVWLGEPPKEHIERQLAFYRSVQGNEAAEPRRDEMITSHDAADIAGQLVAALNVTRADALNIRVHVPGVTPEQAREQIEVIANEVVPLVRAEWPGVTAPLS